MCEVEEQIGKYTKSISLKTDLAMNKTAIRTKRKQRFRKMFLHICENSLKKFCPAESLAQSVSR